MPDNKGAVAIFLTCNSSFPFLLRKKIKIFSCEYFAYIALNFGNMVDISENQVYNIDGEHNKFIALLNPFRYRGYYFDSETNLYFLQSRYYDPELGRFISADNVANLNPQTINGLNIYVYCLNNPISYIDRTGCKPEVNVGVDIWSLYNRSGDAWLSGRYKPKRDYILNLKNPFEHFGNNLAYMGELFLSIFEARAISWTLKVGVLTDTGLTLLSAGVDLFDGRMYLSNTDYLGIKVGSAAAKIGLDWGNDGLIGGELKATALTVGAYSKYVDAELLLGSVSFTGKFENGALKIGLSLGWGIEITIRFW